MPDTEEEPEPEEPDTEEESVSSPISDTLPESSSASSEHADTPATTISAAMPWETYLLQLPEPCPIRICPPHKKIEKETFI